MSRTDTEIPPTGASELARLVGLEGRVRGALAEMRRQGGLQQWTDGDFHESLGKLAAADLLEAALSAPPAEPTEPGMLTTEQMIKVWRELRQEGHSVMIEPSTVNGGDGEEFCLITTNEATTYHAFAPDPLTAFGKAYAAFVAAWENKEQGE